jgi:hypothetical protein
MKKQFKKRNDLILLDGVAREIAKQVIAINSDRRVNNTAIHALPINTFVFNPALFSYDIQQQIEELDLNRSFATFDEASGSYEIYISTLTKKQVDELINKDGTININGDLLNLSDDFNSLTKKLSTDFYKHELAHTKISSLQKLSEVDKDIPFSLINILEDVRVNSFWNFDKKYELLFNKIYKVDPELFKPTKTGYDILFPICITLNDPKYTYLSPDTEFCKYIFNKTQKANNVFEICQIAKEFLEEMKKRHPEQNQKQEQNAGMNSKENNEEQQEQSQGNIGNNDFSINEDEEEDRSNDYDYLEGDDFSNSYQTIQDSQNNSNEESSEYGKNKASDANSLLGGKGDLVDGLSESDKELIRRITRKIKDEAIKITDNGAIIKGLDQLYDNETVQRIAAVYGRKRDFNNNDIEQILEKPLSNIQKGDISLNLPLINKYFNEAKKELSKFFPKTANEVSSKLSKNLNNKKIASLPFNPTLKDLFKEPLKRKKEPIMLTFFLDLSGSMRGNPIFNSKHLLAVVKKLQDAQYVDANIVLHRGGYIDNCAIIKFKNFNQKPFEIISALRAQCDEGIINAINYSLKSIRQDLRRSRAIFFLTDANLCDDPEKIKAAMSKIENKNIIGLYAGDSENSELSRYFANFISAKKENSKDLNQTLKILVKVVTEIANPDLTTKKAIERIAKNPEIYSSYGLENRRAKVNRDTEDENINSSPRIKA